MGILNESEKIGVYTVQSLIKSNLYTETYRVVDDNSNPYFLKVYDLKKTPPKLINQNTFTVKEIEYCQQQQHPNLASFISSGNFERNECPYQYYVTNYFNGTLLADDINQSGTLEEDNALRIFKEILGGLNHLHTLTPPLCHNDLDVSNIIISQANKQAEIIDLGHMSERCVGVVWFDTADLNPLYHANETMVGIFDEQGDIFSACAILYTMVAGRAPWDIEINAEASYKEKFKELFQYRRSHPLDLSSLNVSNKTKHIISKGLSLKSSSRFQSIEEILAILNSAESPANQDDTHTNEPRNHKATHEDSDSQLDPNQVDIEIKRGGGNGFEDIAGMQELKQYLTQRVIFVLKEVEIAQEYNITPPNGLLLYGPPGCGKTFFAEKFAEETGFNFLLVKSSDLGSSLVHGSQEKIKKLFKLAEKNAPIVVCFDEFDALVPDRSAPGSQYVASEVNEFLSQMNNCSKKGIFIVATSNRPDKIDPAVLRTGRIDKQVFVPLPDYEARKEMFKLYLKNRPVESDIDVDTLAQRTEGYIASDIAYIVNDAAMTAAFAREKINSELLSNTLNNIRPSLRKESLEIYSHIKDTMESVERRNACRTIVNPL